MPAPNIRIFDDGEQVAAALAERFAADAAAAIRATGRFSAALSGGSTPKRTYELLASQDFRAKIDWKNVHIFFGDERTVGPTSDQSNFRMASLAMLDHVGLPSRNVHRIIGEADPKAAAVVYDAELKTFFADQPWPVFDLNMLGMGDDGHTASLFPGSSALSETRAWVVSNWVEKLHTFRITLSAPAINASRHIIFAVTGSAKAQALAQVLHGPRDPQRLPSQLIAPASGNLEWLLDKAAAANL